MTALLMKKMMFVLFILFLTASANLPNLFAGERLSEVGICNGLVGGLTDLYF